MEGEEERGRKRSKREREWKEKEKGWKKEVQIEGKQRVKKDSRRDEKNR